MQKKVLNPYFLLSAIVFIIAAAAAILFPIGQMAGNPKALVRALVSIAVLAVIYLISWSLASDSIDADYYKEFNISPGQSKFIGSMIYVVYILGGLSILTVIFSGIYGMISKR